MTAYWVTSELDLYATTLLVSVAVLDKEAAKIVLQSSSDLRDGWKANAVATSGAHGKHYPNSIESHMLTPLSAEIAPNPGKPQGGMSFEFGSRNQPPHLDGERALQVEEPKFVSALELAASVAMGA